MEWYPRYPALFDDGTLGFSLAEKGAYSCLIDHYYKTSQPLPADDAQIASILRVSVDEWLSVAHKVRSKFTLRGKKLVQKKCERELAKQAQLSEISRENGKKGGRPRIYKNPEKTQQDTQQEPSGVPGTNPEKTTDRQTDNKNLNTPTVPIAARGLPVDNSGEQVNNLNGDSSRASRASPKANGHHVNGNGHANGEGKYTPQKKRERWIQNVQNFLYRTLPADQATEIITGFADGNAHFIKKFEEASERMNSEKHRAG